MFLSKDRHGKFTASIGYEVIPGARGGMAKRDKCIMDRAEEICTGMQKEIFGRALTHGTINEFEAGEEFKKLSGLIVESNDQRYMPIDANSGATPDFLVKDFSDIIIATVDTKCPLTKFFEQKMMVINESKPEYQNTPLQMFVQAQMQMKAATVLNATMGHPPVTKHYLVRYLTSCLIDDDGMKIEIDLPIESRMFWKEITFDQLFYDTILQPNIDSAAEERDKYVTIFKQPII